jgi:hypothetical protein
LFWSWLPDLPSGEVSPWHPSEPTPERVELPYRHGRPASGARPVDQRTPSIIRMARSTSPVSAASRRPA